MSSVDELSVPHPLSPSPSWERVGERVRSIDKKCLAEAIAITAMSWFAVPIIYWLIVRKKNGEKIDSTAKVHSESKETEKK